ncbi:hypothetical protein RFI_31438 [Reticulomyxa filosa]|uniref:Uncharacterized protein n=1 Tax=Reticulomyxa filosa TaxID=46433 RepID=X6LVL1_RETFI|nr:hypothetical protein RFI_31438 [Reticulomyxa filosa]|eukprot:ETO05958.1 hypothetical protein RFI_31438 [Reticulomyxa filosa]
MSGVKSKTHTYREQTGSYQVVEMSKPREKWDVGEHVLCRLPEGCQWFHGFIVEKVMSNGGSNDMKDSVRVQFIYHDTIRTKIYDLYSKDLKSPNEGLWDLFTAKSFTQMEYKRLHRYGGADPFTQVKQIRENEMLLKFPPKPIEEEKKLEEMRPNTDGQDGKEGEGEEGGDIEKDEEEQEDSRGKKKKSKSGTDKKKKKDKDGKSKKGTKKEKTSKGNLPKKSLPKINFPKKNLSKTSLPKKKVQEGGLPETKVQEGGLPETKLPKTKLPRVPPKKKITRKVSLKLNLTKKKVSLPALKVPKEFTLAREYNYWKLSFFSFFCYVKFVMFENVFLIPFVSALRLCFFVQTILFASNSFPKKKKMVYAVKPCGKKNIYITEEKRGHLDNNIMNLNKSILLSIKLQNHKSTIFY